MLLPLKPPPLPAAASAWSLMKLVTAELTPSLFLDPKIGFEAPPRPVCKLLSKVCYCLLLLGKVGVKGFIIFKAAALKSFKNGFLERSRYVCA